MAFLLILALLALVSFWTSIASPYDIDCSSNCQFSTFSIKYPFGLGNNGCGDPNFQIECVGNFPVLNIKDQKYRMDGADYENRKIEVYNEMALESSCYLPNATMDLRGSPFQVAPPYSTLYFLLHCRSQPILGPNFTKIRCSNNKSYLGFTDPKGTNWSRYCTSVFHVLTQRAEPGDLADGEELPEGLTARAYAILRRTFSIQWDTDGNRDKSCKSCQSSGGICGYNNSDAKYPFLCYCRDGPQSSNCSRSKHYITIIIGGCIGGGSALVLAVAVVMVIRIKRRNHMYYDTSRPSDFRFGETEMGNLAVFSYKELEEATNFFDDNRQLGDGGFGVVYLGKLRDGRAVAVKRLHEDNSRRAEQFMNEVKILATVCHFNLVRLFGCCHEDHRNLLLVYEYVPNGTLADHLHGEKKGKGLDWETRLNIAIETAQALAFLHFWVKPPIFHRDVKSTNILLDENLRAKVADFGLSRLVPLEATHISTVPQGTPGYLDPDYHQNYQLTDKSDVYSFGVVLAEIISAKKAVDISRDRNEINLAHLATSKIQGGAFHDLVDPDLQFESNPMVKAMITSVAELAFVCLAAEKDDRPCMMEVVSQLLRIKQMGYGCQKCQKLRGSRREKFKLATGVPPFSPTSVQAMWSCTSASTEASA